MKVVSKMHLEYLNPKASGAVYTALSGPWTLNPKQKMHGSAGACTLWTIRIYCG
jgi:hypothetical protein